MPKHYGDFDTSAIIYGKFTSVNPSTGAPFTLAGTPALSVYKDNSTTESTSGVTLTADFDSRTGFNHFAIDTSSDGTFYSAGSFFEIVITTGTVNSISAVGQVVAAFTLRKNSSLKPTTAGRTLLVDASGDVTLTAGQLTVKKNTGFTMTFPMFDSAGSPATGLTVAGHRSIDGAAVAGTANSPSELSGGLYNLTVAAADVNGNMINFYFTATGAKTQFIAFITQA